MYFNYKEGNGKKVVLFCFQSRRVSIEFDVTSLNKTLSIVSLVAFSKYKDLHCSLFFQCFFHLSFHIFLSFSRFFSYRKNLQFSFCCLTDFYRSLSIALFESWHKTFLFMIFFFEITLLHFSFYVLILFWSAHFRLRLKSAMQMNSFIRHLVSCRLRCNSTSTKMISISILLKRSELCHSEFFCSRSFFVNHCFTTAQLICDSATTLMRNFSLWRAFQNEATVWL